MRKLLIVMMAIFCGGMAFAASCPKCNGPLLASDAFCAGCGLDILEWRRQSSYQRQSSGQNGQRALGVDTNRSGSRAFNASEYPFMGTMACYLEESDLKTPVKFGFASKLALPWDDCCSIYGLNLAVFAGSCHTQYGLSVCAVGNTSHTAGGICFGLFNICHDAAGLQVGFYNSADELKGIQIGIANFASPRDSIGMQIGVFNTFKHGFDGDGWFFPGINICF